MAVIGKVSFLFGTVFAEDAAGNQRLLSLGDEILEGERIITVSGAKVELDMLSGDQITVTDGQSWSPTGETFSDPQDFSAGDATLSPEDLALQEALLTPGADPTQFGEATAAGAPAAGAPGTTAGDGGTSFVTVERTAGEVNPDAGYETTGLASQIVAPVIDPQVITPITPITPPTVSINDVTVNEDAGTMVFTVTLSNATDTPVTFNFVTTEGGTATPGKDYGQVNTTVTIPAGETSITISVPVTEDYIKEGTENFNVELTGLTGNIAEDGHDTEAVGTITDAGTNVEENPDVPIEDVTEPDTVTLKVIAVDEAGDPVSDSTVAEGGLAFYKVIAVDPAGNEIVNPAAGSVSVNFADGSTQGSVDFDNDSQEVAIGDVFSVKAKDDYLADNGEIYQVTLAGSDTIKGEVLNAYEKVVTSADEVATTITDEQEKGPEDTVYAVISVDDDEVAEGGALTYTVKLVDEFGNAVTVPAGESVTVDITWTDAAANATDAAPLPTTVTITGGSETTFVVDAIDDIYKEDPEALIATISNVVDVDGNFEAVAVGTKNTANATITDEGVPGSEDTVSVKLIAVDSAGVELSQSAIEEGEVAYYKVLATTPAGVEVTAGSVDISFADAASNGTQGAADYTAANQNGVTFGSIVSAAAVDDYLKENAEDFVVTMSNVQAPAYEVIAITNASVTTTITDDQPGNESNDTVSVKLIAVDSQGVELSQSAVEEGEVAYYKVMATNPAGVEVTGGSVDISFSDAGINGTQGADDYTAANQNGVAFGSIISAAAVNDYLKENAEDFVATISNVQAPSYENTSITNDSVTTTITDQGVPTSADTVYAVISSNGAVDEGQVSQFTVQLLDENGNPVTVTEATQVTVEFANGTAEGDEDYAIAVQNVFITAGSSSVVVDVQTNKDADYDDETFIATITGVVDGDQFENVDYTSGVNGHTASAVATINDLDTPPTISVNDVTVNEDAGYIEFTVSLSHATTAPVTFSYATADGSATAGLDYTTKTNGGSIATGATSIVIQVPIKDDYLKEGNETFSINLSNLSANLATTGNDVQGIGTITDAGSPGTPPVPPENPETVSLKLIATDSTGKELQVSEVTEGEMAYYKVVAVDPDGGIIANPTAGTVTVNFADGTTDGAADYANNSQVVTINQVFSVQTKDDYLADNGEKYKVSLAGDDTIAGDIVNAYEVVTNSTVVVETTINDEPTSGPEDTVFAVISSNGAVDEGQVSQFTVQLLDKEGNPVTVTEATQVTVEFANGTAEGDEDYAIAVQNVFITAGNSSVVVDVQTKKDDDFDDETFTATITGVVDGDQFENVDHTSGVNGHTPSAVATINDLDTPPTISVNDVTVNEDAGYLEFTVSLSHATTGPVTFSYSTADGSATVGLDYGNKAGGGSIATGATSTVIQVPIHDDYLKEGNETFSINLSGLSANVATTGNDVQGIGTITEDGTPGTPPGTPPVPPENPETVSLKLVATDSAGKELLVSEVTEGEMAYYKVVAVDPDGDIIANPAAGTVTVNFADGTTDGVADYANSSQVVTINQVFSVQTKDDYLADNGEKYKVSLGGDDTIAGDIVNAYEVVTNSTVVVETTINDEPTSGPEDTVFAVISSNGAVDEGQVSKFTVQLLDKEGNPVTVTEATIVTVKFENGTAETGDYSIDVNQVTIPVGSSSAVLNVQTKIDTDFDNETFTATISSVADGSQFENIDHISGVNGQTPSAVATINDLDTPPTISVNDVTVNEDAGYLEFTVSLSHATTGPVTFSYSTADGSATVGLDYGNKAGGGSIATGATSTVIQVPIHDDYLKEGNEIFSINLSNLSANVATTGNDVQGIGTITDAGSPGTPPVPPENPETVSLKLIATDSAGKELLDSEVTEGEMAYYKVIAVAPNGDVIASPAAGTVTVNFADGTTEGAADYANSSQVVTINQVFSVQTKDDYLADNGEHYFVSLAGNETIAGEIINAYEVVSNSTDPVQTTISDEPVKGSEDTVYAVISSHGAVSEGDVSKFTVKLLDHNGTPVTVTKDTDVTVSFANGTAENGDYAKVTQTVSIKAGSSSVLVNVQTIVDQDLDDETFTATINSVNDQGQFEKVIIQTPTAEGVINDLSTPPDNLTGTTTIISEEGLSGGIKDGTGVPADFSDSATAKGSLSFQDSDTNADNTQPFVFTLSGPTGITSGGEAVVWSWEPVSQSLTGVANGGPVAVIFVGDVVSNNGTHTAEYEVTLLAPLTHPTNSVEDVLSLNFNYSVSDGTNTSTSAGSFTVKVEDDMPFVENAEQVINLPQVDTNLMVVLDLSGSMDLNANGDGKTNKQSRLDLAKQAVAKMISSYDDLGDVKVRIVTFSDVSEKQGSVWVAADEAISYLNSLSAGGYTNYDAALNVAQDAFDDAGSISGAQNLSYFFSDGSPTASDGNNQQLKNENDGSSSDDGIQSAEERLWESFLKANDIKSMALGMGTGVNAGHLNPIAYDGVQNTEANATIVTDLSQLDAVLADSIVIPPVSGNILTGANAGYGADGGEGITKVTLSIKIPGDATATEVTFTFDGNSISNDSGSGNLPTVNGSTLSVVTAADAKLSINMQSGDFSYQSTQTPAAGLSETITYTLVDADGDGASATATMSIQGPLVPVVGQSIGTNVLIMLDVSGSMKGGFNGTTRLEAAKSALNDMLNKYNELGDVRVQLATFSDSKTLLSSSWMTIGAAIEKLNSIANPDGGTNYDYALDGMEEAFNSSGKLTGAKNVSYFLSDGVPTLSDANPGSSNPGDKTNENLGDGIDGTEQAAWQTFVTANNIKSHAVAIGDNVAVKYLNPIAYDGEEGAELAAIMPTSLAQLSAGLVNSVVSPGHVFIGTAEADLIVGGLGEDFMTGNGGADTFAFNVDNMSTAIVETDTIMDFRTVEGDKLDLSDLLAGETKASLDNYLNFESLNGDTLVHVNKDGDFANGGQVDQTILLKGVDLASGGASDQKIIDDLLAGNNLLTD
ncbi:MAG: retention module-containing protein [Pseudomonadales bacterium]|nr:retention module-containing protein [Pseudomonadales bacterium]NRA14630.1 retention module-containing protein [Oceanospirillaceae bacterium]